MADVSEEKTPLPEDSAAEEGARLYPNAESVPLSEQPATNASPPATVVVVDQRYADIPAAHGGWSTGLTQCTLDFKLCFLSFLCPLCYSMKVSSEMGESLITPCLVPSTLMGLRQKMRLQQGIPGSLITDCLLETFCFPCALAQLGREVKVRQAHGQMPVSEPGAQGMARQ